MIKDDLKNKTNVFIITNYTDNLLQLSPGWYSYSSVSAAAMPHVVD